jgi:hypothetical protein
MFGRTLLSTNSVAMTRVSADNDPRYKPAGLTLDWSVVTAVSGSDATLPDGSIIKVGQKYLRYGQILTKETAGGTTQTINSTATGGTFAYSFQRSDNGLIVKTGAIAWNASAATILAAIQAVAAPGQALSASGGVLPTAVVVTWGTFTPLGTIDNTAATGGTVTIAQTTAGTTGGYFGPYDSAASDGRQNLNRGDCFVLDETIVQYDTGTPGISPENTQIGRVFDAGLVWIDRVLQAGAGTHSLAAGPTLAEFLAAFPAVRIARN